MDRRLAQQQLAAGGLLDPFCRPYRLVAAKGYLILIVDCSASKEWSLGLLPFLRSHLLLLVVEQQERVIVLDLSRV